MAFDSKGKKLEIIMTGLQVFAQWISMANYFFIVYK
jgi:uncharacterized protein YbcC (UPF0753/DUF2309 family)